MQSPHKTDNKPLRVESQTLSDLDGTGARPWNQHRAETSIVAEYFREGDGSEYVLASRMDCCAGELKFGWSKAGQSGMRRIRLLRAKFCRVRICPMCAWRRSLWYRARLVNRLPERLEPSDAALFLTLTVRNCQITSLRGELKAMRAAFSRLVRMKAWPGRGWVRMTQVTRGKGGPMQAHPHFHVVLLVDRRSYFGPGYLSNMDWTVLWRKALRADYDPIVDVRRIKASEDSLTAAVAEITHYACAPADLCSDGEWTREYAKQTKGTRFADSGQCLRGILGREGEDEPLGDDRGEGVDEDAGSFVVCWRWRPNCYILDSVHSRGPPG